MARRSSCSLCDKPVVARGWCRTHYQRWYKHGDPNTTLHASPLGAPEEVFWNRVDKTGNCWNWTAALSERGDYGVFYLGGKRVSTAHRYAYELQVGPVPEGLNVLHHCDNGLCVRKEHIYAGTQAENVRDRFTHGRGSKLRYPQVKKIKRLLRSRVPREVLAERYGVAKATIQAIDLGRSWKHVA